MENNIKICKTDENRSPALNDINSEAYSENNNMFNNICLNILDDKENSKREKEKLLNLKERILNTQRNNKKIKDNELAQLTNSVINEISNLSTQVSNSNEQNKYLLKANMALRNKIVNKDRIIGEYEEIAKKSKERFKKLCEVNQNLKKKINIIKESQKNEEEDNNINNINNDPYINDINEVKDDLLEIESEYNEELESKDKEIEHLSKELTELKELNINIDTDVQDIKDKIKEKNDFLYQIIDSLKKEIEVLKNQNIIKQKEINNLKEKIKTCPYEVCRISQKDLQEEYSQFMKDVSKKEINYLTEINNLHTILQNKEKLKQYIINKNNYLRNDKLYNNK